MKLYIVTENAVEYNDEYNYTPESEGGKPIAAFKSRENATREARAKNAQAVKDDKYEFEGGETPELYSVTEVECEDADLVGYADRLAAKKEAAEKAAAAAKAHLAALLAKVFASCPEMVAVRWNQYTPHFNDGDTCTFGVHEARFRFSETEGDAGDYEDGFVDSYSLEGARKIAAKSATSAVDSIDEEDMEKTFGDHVQVTANRDGTFTVDEHEHD